MARGHKKETLRCTSLLLLKRKPTGFPALQPIYRKRKNEKSSSLTETKLYVKTIVRS